MNSNQFKICITSKCENNPATISGLCSPKCQLVPLKQDRWSERASSRLTEPYAVIILHKNIRLFSLQNVPPRIFKPPKHTTLQPSLFESRCLEKE